MKKTIFVFILVCTIILSGCSNSGSPSQPVESQENEPIYDTLQEFQNTDELNAYMKNTGLMQENTTAFNVISPYNGQKPYNIVLHGNNIYYYFENELSSEVQLALGYNYKGSGKKGLEYFAKENPDEIYLYSESGTTYCSKIPGGDEPITGYMFYWVYEDYLFQASVPLEEVEVVLANLESAQYIQN